MSCDELVEGGQDLDEGRELAHLLASTRRIGFLDLSVASYTVPSIGHHVADMSEGHAPYLAATLEVAAAAGDVPVLAACRYLDLVNVERALGSGLLTAVAMTRAHIADPHLVRKTLEGRQDEVRPCVSCNFCIGEIGAHRPITCMMNPAVGREASWPVNPEPAATPRTVLVVGGGPAGLETARVAAERGHAVSLWEAGDDLGGQLRTGRRGVGRGELDRLVRYERTRLDRLGVGVRTGARVDRRRRGGPRRRRGGRRHGGGPPCARGPGPGRRALGRAGPGRAGLARPGGRRAGRRGLVDHRVGRGDGRAGRRVGARGHAGCVPVVGGQRVQPDDGPAAPPGARRPGADVVNGDLRGCRCGRPLDAGQQPRRSRWSTTWWSSTTPAPPTR